MICIGPLTFLICIDNLPAVFSNHYTNVNLFADDVLLYHLITDAMDYAVLQEAITLLEDWSITNHLNFNVSFLSIHESMQNAILHGRWKIVYGS